MSLNNELLSLHPDDNILIATTIVQAGANIYVDGLLITVEKQIPIGHKVARWPMAAGTKIMRYGAPIGSLTADVAAGEHVHLHNLKSDYIATHDRETVTGAAHD